MKGFFSWFNSKTKIKKWMFLSIKAAGIQFSFLLNILPAFGNSSGCFSFLAS
mgnify:CR=1 FL=1